MACFFDLDVIYKNKNSELKQEVKKLMNILPQRKRESVFEKLTRFFEKFFDISGGNL